MTPRRGAPALLRAPETNSVLRYARGFQAEAVAADRGLDDAAVTVAVDRQLERMLSLAASPSASQADVALKLAAVLQLRLASAPAGWAEADQAEVALLASSLCDLVLAAEG